MLPCECVCCNRGTVLDSYENSILEFLYKLSLIYKSSLKISYYDAIHPSYYLSNIVECINTTLGLVGGSKVPFWAKLSPRG